MNELEKARLYGGIAFVPADLPWSDLASDPLADIEAAVALYWGASSTQAPPVENTPQEA